MPTNKPVLYTIGHSVHPIDVFINLLKKHNIMAVADVRSSPYSKFTPQFNREGLKVSLKNAGIQYVFLGEELGARRTEPECYQGSKVIFSKVAKTPAFQRGIRRLVDGALKMSVAIMCAEKDPLTCHRTILVAHYARDLFSEAQHILEDGNIETGSQADLRLLKEYELEKEDLFSNYSERLEIAYSRRAEKIAYEENQDKQT